MEIIGCCKYCGQSVMIEPTDELREEFPAECERLDDADTDDEETAAADNLASLLCRCKDGKDFRAFRKRIKNCEDQIEAMFRESYPMIADVLQETKEAVLNGEISVITCKDGYTGGVASMFLKKDRLKIRWKKPIEMEIDAG